MQHPACLISTDASMLRLITESDSSAWTAVPIGDEDARTSGAWFARIRDAAQWLVEQPGSRRRFSLICIDTHDALCSWLRSPSAATPVLSATWRGVSEEWGRAASTMSVHPLTAPHAEQRAPERRPPFLSRAKKSAEFSRRHHGPVIAIPDGLARLWLDQLDLRGIRPGTVLSFWHAMALAWDDAASDEHAPITATLVQTGSDHLAWCWSRAGRLLCGGNLASPMPHATETGAEPPDTSHADSCAQRIILDWLSWSTLLGDTPHTIRAIGPGAESLIAALRRRLPDTAARAIESPDPVDETIRLAAERWPQVARATDPSSCLSALTNRPTRAVRKRFEYAALLLIILAVATAGFGFRLRQSAAGYQELAAGFRANMTQRINESPNAAITGRNPIMELRSQIAEEMSKPQIKLPPSPRPLFEEIERVLTIINAQEGVHLTQLTIDDRSNATIRLNIPSRETGVTIRAALAQSPGAIAWEPTTTRAPVTGDQSLTLTGRWTR